MKIFFALLYLEIKRALHTIPQLLLGAIVLSFLIGTIAFCSGRLLYQEEALGSSAIALAVEEDSGLISTALDLVTGMESTQSFFQFQMMEPAQARQALDAGQVIAVIQLPANMIDSILDGSNTPVQVIFPQRSEFGAVLLKELTLAGAKILASAQADIYVTADLYTEYGLTEYLPEAFQTINLMNLKYALARDQLFQTQSASATGSYSVLTYYLASALLLMLLLWGTNCSQFLKGDPDAFYRKLSCHGIKAASYMLIKLLTVWAMLVFTLLLIAVLTFAAGTVFSNMTGGLTGSITDILVTFSFPAAVSLLLVLLCVSAMILFAYQAAPTPGSGILFLFILSVLLLFLSGGFIPVAFFPPALKEISAVLPTTYLLHQIANTVVGSQMNENIIFLLLYTLLFYGASTLAFLRRENL